MTLSKFGVEGAAKRLGYSSLKSLQVEVIISFATGHDVFTILPTGYGKSLCYACLPAVFDTQLSNLLLKGCSYWECHRRILPCWTVCIGVNTICGFSHQRWFWKGGGSNFCGGMTTKEEW